MKFRSSPGFFPMSHPNVKCGRANSKLEDNLSYSELYKSESSDEDMPSCLKHPNVNIARDVKFMDSLHPKCNFIDHPNVIVSRSHKFRHCQKKKELKNESCCHSQRIAEPRCVEKKKPQKPMDNPCYPKKAEELGCQSNKQQTKPNVCKKVESNLCTAAKTQEENSCQKVQSVKKLCCKMLEVFKSSYGKIQ
jgi:hypothetical protein